jgi:hypothetical protein
MHKPGAGGVMGTATLATMEADGYTISVMHNSVIRAPLVAEGELGPAQGLHLPDRPGGTQHGIVVARRRALEDAARAAGGCQEAARCR